MTPSQQLEESLALTVQHVKALHAALSAVMVEVTALRQTVLKSRDVNRFRSRIQTGTEQAKPLVQTAMRSYDDLIRQIDDSGETGNDARDAVPVSKSTVQ